MKNVIYVIVALIIIFVIYYFVKPSNNTQQTQTPTSQMPINTQNQVPTNQAPTAPITNVNNNPITPAQAPSAKTINISIINFTFNPGVISINRGDTIIWTNNDSVPHQIKGDNLSNLGGQVMSNGQTYSYTFNDTGTFAYHCNIHPSMTGSIIVK